MALVFLCGQKACGKTFFLNKLLKIENFTGFDLDEKTLCLGNEKNIRELYNSVGESKFRKLENNAFEQLISECGTNAFIAMGGGSLEETIKAGTLGETVYLYQKPEILFERMMSTGLPPFMKNRADFDKLFNFRNDFYLKNCKHIIDLSETEEDTVCRILSELYLN